MGDAAVVRGREAGGDLQDLGGGQPALGDHAVEGLALDWLVLPRSLVPRTIGETELRSRTGVSVIALVREGITVPAPGPDHELRPGDTIVVTGTTEGIGRAIDLLSAAPAS